MGKLRFVQMAGIGGKKGLVESPTSLNTPSLNCPECGKQIGYPLARQRMYHHLIKDHANEGWGEQDAKDWCVENIPVGPMKPLQANHAASEPSAETKRKIASMGLFRVAGNVYECPSTQDFWQVTGGGKIVRLSGDEVDNGESIAAAPTDKPMEFLSSILDDLSF